MTSPARLIARYGTQPSQEYILNQPVTMIGREPLNEIALDDSEVSRRHARITIVGGAFQIEDLGSTNGTFVNGQRVAVPTNLKHDDIIDFAETQRFRFVAAGVEDTPPMNFEANYPATVVDDQPAAYPAPIYPEPNYPPTQFDAQPAALPDQLYPPTQIDIQPLAVSPPLNTVPLPAEPAWDAGEPEIERGRTPLLLGCVLAVILAIIVLIVVVVLLDGYNNGELLYCGPLRPLFAFIAESTGQVLACP